MGLRRITRRKGPKDIMEEPLKEYLEVSPVHLLAESRKELREEVNPLTSELGHNHSRRLIFSGVHQPQKRKLL